MKNEELVSINNLKLWFKYEKDSIQVLRGIDLSVNQGEIVGIIGESGSGKSVTSTSILGFFRDEKGAKAEGEIIYKGQDLLKFSEKEMRAIRGKEISYIFQDPVAALNPYRKVGGQIGETLKLHKISYSKASVIDIMKEVGIDNAEVVFSMYPFQLSGGQCQRIAIAMSLALKPNLLIADEPTSAIDASLQRKVLELLKNTNERLNTAIIIVTHDFDVARYLCHKIVVMYGGLVMEEGQADEIFARPKHPYTRALINCSKSLQSREEVLYSLEGRAPNPAEFRAACPFYERCEIRNKSCNESIPHLIKVNDNLVRCKNLQEYRDD